MPVLTLKFKDDVIGDFPLEKGKSLSIGRRNDNDITVENLAVSGYHAKIDSIGDRFLLTDLQAKNGTFVNEHKIETHWLDHEDDIIIGKHHLTFTYAPDEERPEASTAAAQETMIMDTENYRQMMAKNKARKQEEPEKEAVGMLSFLAGGEGEIELNKKLVKIGKNASSDIIVTGLTIGQTAMTISKRQNGYHLSYVSGLAKPKVNSKSIKESVLLNQFDMIEIGSLKMQFIYKG